MKMKRRNRANREANRFHLPTIVVIAASITLLIGISTAVASGSGKKPWDPWEGLTDAQKQAQVDAAHAANVRYLNDFEARHGDPRSLPVIKISTWQPPPPSLGLAASRSSYIAHGQVKSVRFIADRTGNMPTMQAAVTVAEVGKGSLAVTVTVTQLGGPVAQPNGKGALVELEYDPLMLPGDDVLLLLSRTSTGGGYQPIYGAGVLFISNGKLHGETSARYGLEGKDYAAAWESLADPSLPTSAYPLQSAAEQ